MTKRARTGVFLASSCARKDLFEERGERRKRPGTCGLEEKGSVSLDLFGGGTKSCRQRHGYGCYGMDVNWERYDDQSSGTVRYCTVPGGVRRKGR